MSMEREKSLSDTFTLVSQFERFFRMNCVNVSDERIPRTGQAACERISRILSLELLLQYLMFQGRLINEFLKVEAKKYWVIRKKLSYFQFISINTCKSLFSHFDITLRLGKCMMSYFICKFFMQLSQEKNIARKRCLITSDKRFFVFLQCERSCEVSDVLRSNKQLELANRLIL